MIAALLARAALFAARRLCSGRAVWLGGQPLDAQRIYCANHTSHLDAVLLMASLPEPLRGQPRPVAAAGYWRAGPIRSYWAQRVFRAVLIDRESRQLNPLEPAFQALRHGDSLILFPEGTRGPGGGLQPLKPGLFYLARAFPHVEIVPVWIGNAHRILPRRARLPLPARCSVTFGVPLRWEGEEDAAAFLGRVRAGIESAARSAGQTSCSQVGLERLSANDA